MYRVIFGENDAGSNSALQVWNGASLTAVTGIPFEYANPSAPSFPTHPAPQYMARFGDAVYFMAPTLAAPYLALFKSDGVTAGLAANVALPSGLISGGGTLYFAGYTGTPTAQTTAIWTFDGSTASVAVEFNVYGNMQPTFLMPYNGGLVFTADDGIHGREPWFWNGTSVSAIGDINTGRASANSSYFASLNNKLYFAADDGVNGRQLWGWDGATASIAANLAAVPGGANPVYLTNFNGAIYFVANSDTVAATNGAYTTYVSGLWRWDGQTATMVTNFGANTPGALTVAGNKLYFSVNDGVHGSELWAWDGSTSALVTDIAPGATGSNPVSLAEVGGNLYFFANDSVHGVQPWSYNGTSATMLGSLSPSSDWNTSSSSALIAGFGHPTVAEVNLTASQGGALNATVSFDAPVQVSGTPGMTITVNGQIILASYVGGSGGKSISFETASGAMAGTTIMATATALSFNGGSIVDQDGNVADLSFTATPQQIFAAAPTVTSSTSQSVLNASGANEAIAGSGLDVLNLSTQASTNYTITSNGDNSFNLADTVTGSTNHVAGVMQLQFSDKTVTIAAANSVEAHTALLYQAALGRTPDSAGLAGWERITAGLSSPTIALGVYGLSDAPGGYNGNLSIAGGFTQSAEFINKYGSMTDTQFVTNLYTNILDRTPDSAGFDGWMAQLNSGTSREHVLVGFAESAEALTNATVGFVGLSGAHPAWLMLV